VRSFFFIIKYRIDVYARIFTAPFSQQRRRFATPSHKKERAL